MSLSIAVKDVELDQELIAAARGFAAAAGWEARTVHVRAAGEQCPARPPGADHAELVGDAPGELIALVARGDVDGVAVGLRAGGGMGLGRVAEALLAAFAVPVLLVRPGMRPLAGLRRVLVPLEGTPSTCAAMRFAEAVLCRPGREVVMLNVATARTPAEAGSLPAPRIIDEDYYDWQEWQDEFSRRFARCCQRCAHRVAVVAGDPPAAVVREARDLEADLIVLTWRGTFDGGHGRVVRRALEESPCALLVVPEDWAPA